MRLRGYVDETQSTMEQKKMKLEPYSEEKIQETEEAD